MTEKKIKTRQVWGAGYHAGYLAGQNEDSDLKQDKIDRAVRGLTSISHKVYNCVPISEPWDKSKINSELRRCGTNQPPKVVDGCLNGLKSMKLIKEPKQGHFIKISASNHVVAIKELDYMAGHTQEDNKKQESTMRDPIEIIEELTAKMDSLKSDMDAAALEISEYFEKSKKDLEKMHQLQILLKAINE